MRNLPVVYWFIDSFADEDACANRILFLDQIYYPAGTMMILHVHWWPHNPTPFTNTRNMNSRLQKQHRQYPPHPLPVAVWAGTSHPLPNHGRGARHRLLVKKRYQGRIVVIRRVRRMRVLTHPPRAVHRPVRSRRTPQGPSPFPNREATRERMTKTLSKIWVRHSMPSLGCVVLLMLSIFEWIRRNPEVNGCP